ncbi:minor capsid protein [Priestia megaterium]
MVSTLDLVKLLRTNLPDLTFYPLEFPIESPDSALSVDTYGSGSSKAGVYTVQATIKIRSAHPAQCEIMNNRIRNFLDKKSDFPLGTSQVVFAESSNPMPLYMGKDGASRYLYSNNFTLIINEEV